MTATTVSDPQANRAIRQRDLVPPAALAQWHALVIGVGAIGRQVALQLAAMGIESMTLVDHDQVAIENLAVQGYRPHEIGRAKVDVTAEACSRILPELKIQTRGSRFTRSAPLDLPCLLWPPAPKLAVFACVDSMSGRRMIYETIGRIAHLLVDGRMAGETLRVLAAIRPAEDPYYVTTLFEDSRAHPMPCTGRSTLYAASIAAGLMLSRFASHLRGQIPGRDLLLQLAVDELAVL